MSEGKVLFFFLSFVVLLFFSNVASCHDGYLDGKKSAVEQVCGACNQHKDCPPYACRAGVEGWYYLPSLAEKAPK